MRNISNLLSRLRLNYSNTLAIILLACFLLVSFDIKNYGASYDETSNYEYAALNARVYVNLVFGKPYEYMVEVSDLRWKGPAYWLLGENITVPLRAIFPALDVYDSWHIVNFATFLLGAWCLFCLAKRFTSQRAAFTAALLYLTQPLLWGHGVINPKDTPFMTFFLASVLTGVRMIEEVADPSTSHSGALNLFRGQRRRYLVGFGAFVSLFSLVDLVSAHSITRPLLTALIGQAYSAPPGSFLHSLFLRFAAHSDTISVSAYINKALQIINVAEFAVLILAGGGFLVYWLVRTSSRNRWIVLSGVVTGMTISIRVLGPAALGLVTLYALSRLRVRSLLPLAGCLGVALVTAYAFWPYLWSNPAGHFRESLEVMANFPWPGEVRFQGNDLAPSDLPWYYLPKLISIQLTLPALALAAAGLVLIIRSAMKRLVDWGLAAIPPVWFFIPLAGVLLAQSSTYDNFRQFLFIMPPLFLLAAVAIDAVFKRIRPVLWQSAFALAILVPGITAGIWLHPYEYVYYNALVGWTGGIERQYENDYWFTSVCDTAHYLDSIAGDGARIGVTTDVVKTLFLRCADKKFVVSVERVEASKISADYSVIPTRYNDDIDYFRNMKVINIVGRGKTEFTVIKKASP